MQCNQQVYRGSQYYRVVGRQCRRAGTIAVRWPGSQVTEVLCSQHATDAVARGAETAEPARTEPIPFAPMHLVVTSVAVEPRTDTRRLQVTVATEEGQTVNLYFPVSAERTLRSELR